jgi:acyl dehydratase
MAGRWFEEFIVGQTVEHEIRRTVLEADSMWFMVTKRPEGT